MKIFITGFTKGYSDLAEMFLSDYQLPIEVTLSPSKENEYDDLLLPDGKRISQRICKIGVKIS